MFMHGVRVMGSYRCLIECQMPRDGCQRDRCDDGYRQQQVALGRFDQIEGRVDNV